MNVYFNDSDPFVAQWLRLLIEEGALPAGFVDERDIRDLAAADLAGYDQCHFFAGIGGWPYALDLARWHGPVWTGSCPCQPLSSAGQRKGHADERHLWPAFHRLIAECRPATVFGEQVASKDGREWLAGVRADLEELGYAVGAADLCAAGVGAPHIRQRLYWVAQSLHAEPRRSVGVNRQDGRDGENARRQEAHGQPRACGEVRGLGDAARDGGREDVGPEHRSPGSGQARGHLAIAGQSERLGNADTAGPQGRRERSLECADQRIAGQAGHAGFWSRAILIPCADGKARRVEPGIFPLAHGVPNRVGTLRGAGNAICSQVAAEFVSAFLETHP